MGPEITELFTSYMRLCTFLQRYSLSLFSSEGELGGLRNKFSDFKKMGKKVFQAYLASNIGMHK